MALLTLTVALRAGGDVWGGFRIVALFATGSFDLSEPAAMKSENIEKTELLGWAGPGFDDFPSD